MLSSVIQCVWKRFQSTQSYRYYVGQGRPSVKSQRNYRCLVIFPDRIPFCAGGVFETLSHDVTGIHVSDQTDQNILHRHVSSIRRPSTCPVLTRQHRGRQFNFA